MGSWKVNYQSVRGKGNAPVVEWEARRWVETNVSTNKINFYATERRKQADVSVPDAEDECEELHDPCPELPMVTPADSARKYICWGLYFRGLPRATAEWMANYLVDEIKGGRGDEPEDEKLRRTNGKKSKADCGRLPAKG